jgi:hypothetical protein
MPLVNIYFYFSSLIILILNDFNQVPNRTKILVFNQWKSIEQAKEWLKQKPNLQQLLERKRLGDGGNVCRSRKGRKGKE